MTVAYACDLNVYVCVNFRDEIMLRWQECKTWVNLNFFQNWENNLIKVHMK